MNLGWERPFLLAKRLLFETPKNPTWRELRQENEILFTYTVPRSDHFSLRKCLLFETSQRHDIEESKDRNKKTCYAFYQRAEFRNRAKISYSNVI